MKQDNMKNHHSVLCNMGLLFDRNISSIERELYLYVKFRYQLFKKNGRAFEESVPTIAKQFDLDARTIRRAMTNLVAQGYLVSHAVVGRATQYRLPEPEKWSLDPCQASQGYPCHTDPPIQ